MTVTDRNPLREYYAAQTPSASCLKRLKALEAPTEQEPLPQPNHWARALTAAALIVFVVGVSLWANSVVNLKSPAETAAPPQDLAVPATDPALTPVPEGSAPSAPVENAASPEPVESAAPPEPLPTSGSAQPPEEGDAGSGSGSPAPAAIPTQPAMGGSGMGLPSPRDMFPGYTFVSNSDGTVYATHYSLPIRHYLFLVSTDGAQRTIDVTDLIGDDGVYESDVTVGNHTVHVTLDIRLEGGAALTLN